MTADLFSVVALALSTSKCKAKNKIQKGGTGTNKLKNNLFGCHFGKFKGFGPDYNKVCHYTAFQI